MYSIGYFIWYYIEKDHDEILSLILDEYEVEKTVAEKDLDEFLDKLRQVDII